jgi:cytochrome d ubiquinol oxidase subunit I
MTEYPIFDVPMLGGSMLIAVMAIVHVIISHFSVGSGLLAAMAERRAIREGDETLREGIRRYAFLILLVPYVLGTVTGVGIWFTIALVNPRAVSMLIHQFVWDWAIEWVLFLVEGTAIYLYVFRWRQMEAKAHNRIGWIFAGCSIGTLVIINAILSFMLTPGAWKPFDAGAFNWKAVLNPTYLPTTLGRVLISTALAGVGAVVLTSLDRKIPAEAKKKIVSLAYKFMVPAILCLPLGAWTYSRMPDRAQVFLQGAAAPMVLFLGFGVAGLIILFVAAAVSLWRKDFAVSTLGGLLLLLMASVSFGAMEFVREGVRKPYVIDGYMYSTGVTTAAAEGVDRRANIARTRRDGILSASPWALPPGRKASDLDAASLGRAVYRAACLRCHSIEGYNAVRPLIAGWSAKTIRDLLGHMDEVKTAMPPFPGTDAEADALTVYLRSLNEAAE